MGWKLAPRCNECSGFNGGRHLVLRRTTAHLDVTTNAGEGFVTQLKVIGTEATAHLLDDTIVSFTRTNGTKVDPEMPDKFPVELLSGKGAGAADKISGEPS